MTSNNSKLASIAEQVIIEEKKTTEISTQTDFNEKEVQTEITGEALDEQQKIIERQAKEIREQADKIKEQENKIRELENMVGLFLLGERW